MTVTYCDTELVEAVVRENGTYNTKAGWMDWRIFKWEGMEQE